MQEATEKLLNQLVSDYKSGLLPAERIYKPQDAAALLYNLTNGNYQYSFKQLKELQDFFKLNLTS